MKKITKKIMALILSFVMILGCIPSFINEASALGDKATLEEILNTVEGGFPNTIEDAWESNNGKQVIYEGGKLKFLPDSIEFDGNIEATLMGTAYSFSNDSFFCNIANDKLISIYSLDPTCGGTYEPVKTIADILATVEFPTTNDITTVPDNAWVSSEGKKLFIYNDNLYAYIPSEGMNKNIINTKTFNVTSGNNEYTACDGAFTFKMKDGKLTSIIYNYDTSLAKGTYEPAPKQISTIVDVLATVPGGFPTSTNSYAPYNAWVSSDGYTSYLYNGFICFDHEWAELIYASYSVTKEENNYIDKSNNITFVMTDEKLTSITYKGCTYNPPKIITVNYDKPETYTALKDLEANFSGDKDKFTFEGENLDSFKSYIWHNEVANNDTNYLGYFLLESKYIFNTPSTINPIPRYKDECESIDKVIYRNQEIDIKTINTYMDIKNNADILNMDTNDIICIRVIYETPESKNYEIYIFEKIYLGKSANITIPTAEGTKVEDLIKNITVTDSTGTAKFDMTSESKIGTVNVIKMENGKGTGKLNNDDILEKDNEYCIQVWFNDTEANAYSAVYSNNTPLQYNGDSTLQNKFSINKDIGIKTNYIINLKQPKSSSSSKTYKVSDAKDTAEKVSGSGKKGSTRTITPIEGKKVSSVIVIDKNGNKVDVTLNADGTYSFVQPASDVTIEVNYKNREITLNIGSTEASVDGEKSNLDVCPVTRNDRTMLPIRFVAENLGAKVEWNEKKPDYVAITRGDTKIEITLGSDIMLVNGKEVKLDSVAFAENDRTYLPVRAISEALNAIVEWNEERPMEVKIYER